MRTRALATGAAASLLLIVAAGCNRQQQPTVQSYLNPSTSANPNNPNSGTQYGNQSVQATPNPASNQYGGSDYASGHYGSSAYVDENSQAPATGTPADESSGYTSNSYSSNSYQASASNVPPYQPYTGYRAAESTQAYGYPEPIARHRRCRPVIVREAQPVAYASAPALYSDREYVQENHFVGSGPAVVRSGPVVYSRTERYRYVPERERVVRVRTRSHKKSAAIVIGSAAGGAAIGALAGGGKGAGVGALVGGLGGFIYDRATAHRHVVY